MWVRALFRLRPSSIEVRGSRRRAIEREGRRTRRASSSRVSREHGAPRVTGARAPWPVQAGARAWHRSLCSVCENSTSEDLCVLCATCDAYSATCAKITQNHTRIVSSPFAGAHFHYMAHPGPPSTTFILNTRCWKVAGAPPENDTASLNTDLAVRLARRQRTMSCIRDGELLASSHERTDWCQIAAAASLHALPSAS